MVLYTSLMLSKDLFVPIGVVAYLYLGLTYGGYPYLIKFLIPAKLRALPIAEKKVLVVTSAEKLAFAVVGCTVLCLLFPVAAPLFFSLFIGVAVFTEAGIFSGYALRLMIWIPRSIVSASRSAGESVSPPARNRAGCV